MRRFAPLLVLSLALFASLAEAQIRVTDPGRSVRTRADLERLLAEYEAALASPAYSGGVKQSIRADADMVTRRLTEGDFLVGDRIEIYLQGEPGYPDTVSVEPGPMISLNLFGDIPLAGVLRSELTDHLTASLSRFLRDPVVRANSQMGMAILGAVGSPGFYRVRAEAVLGDVLMMAGGPAGTAVVDRITIERGGQRLYERDEVQEALRQGLTLDQLNLQAGDQITVPARSQTSIFNTTLAVLGAIGTVSFLIFNLF